LAVQAPTGVPPWSKNLHQLDHAAVMDFDALAHSHCRRMRRLGGAILTEAVPRQFILALLCSAALAAQQLATKYGIAVQYGPDFGAHSWKQEPKLTQQEIGTDIPEGVAPLRPVLQLKGRLPARIDENTIEVIPLSDSSVHDFAKAYPGLNSSAVALRSLLARSQLPGMKALEKADPGTVDAVYSLCARLERVKSPWLRGFVFLLQTTQEESGDLPNNRELTYRFLGVTTDGAYFVTASFAVNHESILKEPVYAKAQKLRNSERQLAAFNENSFDPPLSRLKAVIRSMAAAH
jgi:hypothetical protein